MTTERVLELLKKRSELNKQVDDAYKEIDKIKNIISNLYREIEKIDIEIYRGEEGYL